MKPVPGRFNIILLGQWNTHIFNPDWVKTNLLGLPKGESFDIEILFPTSTHRIIYKSIYLSISPERITLGLNEVSDDSMGMVENIGIKILKLLPHTPITARGVNIVYQEEKPKGNILKRIDNADDSIIEKYAGQISTKTIQRSILREKGVLNFLLIHDFIKNLLDFNFNFHLGVSPEVKQSDLIYNNLFQECNAYALDFIKEIYKITNE